jgi:hypothetical protein
LAKTLWLAPLTPIVALAHLESQQATVPWLGRPTGEDQAKGLPEMTFNPIAAARRLRSRLSAAAELLVFLGEARAAGDREIAAGYTRAIEQGERMIGGEPDHLPEYRRIEAKLLRRAETIDRLLAKVRGT